MHADGACSATGRSQARTTAIAWDPCRFAQVRARKLAEAAAIVNDLLLGASGALAAATAAAAAGRSEDGGVDGEAAGPGPGSSAAEVEAQVGVGRGLRLDAGLDFFCVAWGGHCQPCPADC